MAFIDGDNTDNSLLGTNAGDLINGFGGDDILQGLDGNDILDGGAGIDTVFEEGDVNFTLIDDLLTGRGTDTLISIEQAILVGGDSSNTLNARDFSGRVELYGGGGSDRLYGSATSGSLLMGQQGHDRFEGGDGDDIFNGGDGIDFVVTYGVDVDYTLTDTSLIGRGNDTLIDIERVRLDSGNSDNLIDASGFSGSVMINGYGGEDTIYGGAGGDTISGGDDDDLILGGNDGDNIDGDLGNDSLYGENGNDVITGGEGDDLISGGSGYDVIEGGDGTDTLYEIGDVNFTLMDTLLTEMGNDNDLSSIEEAILIGGVSNNTIDATAFSGSVELQGGEGNDTLRGGAWHDVILGQGGDDLWLRGGQGNDTIDGGAGFDSLYEQGDFDFTLTDTSLLSVAANGLLYGNDTLIDIEEAWLNGGASNNVIDATGFSGDVILFGHGGNDNLQGGSGNDQIVGGNGHDPWLRGFDGDDMIFGDAGTDRVYEQGDVDFTVTDTSLVGRGTDDLYSIEIARLSGGSSDNVLDASNFSGTAELYGMDGNDTIIGGSGDDVIWGAKGDDIWLQGQDGDDNIIGGQGSDRLVESGALNFTLTDTMLLGRGFDTLLSIEAASLTGTNNHNVIDASGFSGTVELHGAAGNDTLWGSDGGGSLHGDAGHDIITGGADDETIVGTDAASAGIGEIDTLTSGSTLDSDLFVLGEAGTVFYNEAKGDPASYANITDFDNVGLHDQIQLMGSSNNYALIDFDDHTLLRYQGNLIAILENVESNTLDLNSNRFVYV